MQQPVITLKDRPGICAPPGVPPYLDCVLRLIRAIHHFRLRVLLPLSLSLFCFFPQCAHAGGEPLIINYPGPEDGGDQRGNYYVRLLDLAMSKTGIPYKLKPYTYVISGARVIQRLSDEQDINITWAMDAPDWEKDLLTVRVPLDKGILGWRLLLINERDASTFAQIRTLNQLRGHFAGQQRDWADVPILRANGLQVVGTSVYESMFLMLEANRFDYFPRGIGEIWDEAARSKEMHIIVEPHIALHYPVQTYFFVSKRNPHLHDLVEKGLHMAMKDGSFDTLFEQFNAEAIKKAQLDKRRVFQLKLPQ